MQKACWESSDLHMIESISAGEIPCAWRILATSFSVSICSPAKPLRMTGGRDSLSVRTPRSKRTFFPWGPSIRNTNAGQFKVSWPGNGSWTKNPNGQRMRAVLLITLTFTTLSEDGNSRFGVRTGFCAMFLEKKNLVGSAAVVCITMPWSAWGYKYGLSDKGGKGLYLGTKDEGNQLQCSAG